MDPYVSFWLGSAWGSASFSVFGQISPLPFSIASAVTSLLLS